MSERSIRDLLASDAALRSLFRYVVERHANDAAHDVGHLLRVADWTLRLGGPEVSSPEAIAAALLHDLVSVRKDSEDRSKASEWSAQQAEPLLRERGFDGDAVLRITAAIRDHSFSSGAAPSDKLGEALQDADRLDALGAIGVMRLAVTGAGMGSVCAHLEDPWAERRPLDDRRFMLDHFFAKLLLLPERMITEAGKAEAGRRAAWMISFLEQFGNEIGAPFRGAGG